MLTLVVATFFNAAFGIVVRGAQRRDLDVLTVGFVNYLAAAAFYLGWSRLDGISTPDPRTVLIGSIGGVIYAGGFLLMLGPLRWRGLGIVAALLGLSVLVPLSASLLAWHETLRGAQIVGVTLALLAIPLLSLDQGAMSDLRMTKLMALGMAALFLANGGAWTIQKWYHTTGLDNERQVYFSYLFGVASLVMLIAWLAKSRRINLASLAWGALLGVCNVTANLALLLALDRLPGAVVFPVMQAGIMIVGALFAAIAWHERPGRMGAAGIAVAAAAVALINIV